MNKTFEKRVEDLERKLFVKGEENPEGVFMRVIDAKKEALPIEEQLKKSVKGWRYNDLSVLRAENETDEELNARAISEAKPLLKHPLAVPVFHEIRDET